MSILLAKLNKMTIPYNALGRKEAIINMTDGCPAKIIVERQININGTTFNNYVSAVFFQKKITIMNTVILNQYNIIFRVVYNDVLKKNIAQFQNNSNDTLSGYLYLLFEQGTIDSHLEEILNTIIKAENSLPFDPTEDGASAFISLSIGSLNTSLKRLGYPNNIVQIPSNDLKEIIQSWFFFLTSNGLEQSVW